MLWAVVLIGGIFSVLAALSAFLITYDEYLKHFPDKRTPLKMAGQAALAAFAFFLAVSVLMAVVIKLF